MTGPYKENGSGTLWTPNEADGDEEKRKALQLIEDLKSSMKEKNQSEQWVGGYDKGDFELEEMYIDRMSTTPSLQLSGNISDVFIDLNIPIKNNKEMQKIAEEINKIVTIDKESSGLYLKPKDFSELRSFTVGDQGRINLGKDYAGKDVRVVVIEE